MTGSSKGFTTILNTMFNSLDTLKNNASDVNTRQQFIGSAQNLATYFNSVSEGLTDIQKGRTMRSNPRSRISTRSRRR